MPEHWRKSETVQITCGNKVVMGTIALASPNSVSLMLEFEAVLDGHVGMMPVLLGDDGVYRSIMTDVAVSLARPL